MSQVSSTFRPTPFHRSALQRLAQAAASFTLALAVTAAMLGAMDQLAQPGADDAGTLASQTAGAPRA